MSYAIIISKQDPASANIQGCLLKSYKFEKKEAYWERGSIRIYEFEEKGIYCTELGTIDADVIIFATRHCSAAGRKSLSVHVPGNWSKADMGGKDRTLCIAPASLVKEMFVELNKHPLEGYEVTLEAVHHGPFTTTPCLFIEIGSSEKEWSDAAAGEIIATTIINVLENQQKVFRSAIAFGSPHYPDTFNKFLLRTEYAIGQICPKYMLEQIDEHMVRQAYEKNVEKIEFALLDWKGLGTGKAKLLEILEKLKIPYRKAQDFI